MDLGSDQVGLLTVLESIGGASSKLRAVLADSELSEPVKQRLERIHDEMVSSRRREAAADLLVDAASLISAAQGLESVLSAVCRRSRLLFDADMAYVSLNDKDRGETFIRTTDGVRTPEYRKLRMPLGTGILGKAAAGENVVMTSAYEGDPSFPHNSAVDLIVEQEGVKSILAATMRVDGELLGALLIADRTHREYTSAEASTLERIASIAAVELQKEAQIQELHDMAAERDRARMEVESRLELIESIHHLDTDLMRLLRNAGSIEDVEQRVLDNIGVRIAIIKADAIPVGHAHSGSEAFEHVCDLFESGKSVMVSIEDGRQKLGIIEADLPIEDERVPLLNRVALVVGALMLNEELRYQAERKLQGQLLTQLLKPDLEDWAGLTRRLKSFAIEEGERVHVSALSSENQQLALRACQGIVDQKRGIVAEHEGVIYVLGAQTPGDELYSELRARLDIEASLAWREIKLSRSSLKEALQLVRRGLGSMRALGISGARDAKFGLGFAGLALSQLPENTVRQIVNQYLEPLLNYDRERKSDLVETAWNLLEANGRVSVVAKQMHLHENTVRQRTERIAQFLGSDWNRGARGLDSHLMLKLWRIVEESEV